MPPQMAGGSGVCEENALQGLPVDKPGLRRALLARRAALPADAAGHAEAALAHNLLASPLLAQTDLVLTYLSMPGEVDTRALVGACLARGLLVAAPRCVPGRLMTWHLLGPEPALVRSSFGVDEPDPARCPQVQPGGAALAVVPGLAFDLQGMRLGSGGGYYDRVLERFCGTSVGLVRQGFLLERLPCVEPHDIPVAWLAGEQLISPIKGDSPL